MNEQERKTMARAIQAQFNYWAWDRQDRVMYAVYWCARGAGKLILNAGGAIEWPPHVREWGREATLPAEPTEPRYVKYVPGFDSLSSFTEQVDTL